MADVFAFAFLENIKVFFVAIMIYAIVYAMLLKLTIFDDKKVNSLIALISAIIVSFTGVVTYAVTYAVNLFVIIVFVVFLLMVLLLFLGVKFDEIAKTMSSNKKIIMAVFLVIFSIVILKGFFALNNVMDTNEPVDNSYEVDTSFNTGLDDVTNKEISGFGFNLNSDLVGVGIFLLIIGIAIWMLG